MGTSNFHNVNARNVYAVLMDYECQVVDEEGNETDEFEYCSPGVWECDEFKAFLKEDAQELAPTLGIGYHHTCDDDPHELRSFCSLDLFQFYCSKTFGDAEITVNINCVMRVGYYEGANLDWFITYDVMGNNTDELDFLSTMQWYSNMPQGMITIQAKNAERWASETADYLSNCVEEFYKKKSMPLAVAARFSNGETIYSKI